MPTHIAQRGLSIYNSGDQILTRLFEKDNNRITAKVVGTEIYIVTLVLTITDDFKEGRCTCPYEGHCKHIAGVIYSIVLDEDNTVYK